MDESLFGSKQQSGRNGSARGGSANGSVVSRGDIARLTGKSVIGPNTVVLSRGELDRIRGMATIKTRDEQEMERRAKEEAKNKTMMAARERKARMKVLEKERKAKEKNTYMGQIRDQENNVLLQGAREQMDEEEDLVKHMNQKCLYALTVGVRDAQVKEKVTRKNKVVAEEKRQDILMEIERLEELQRRGATQAKRREREREDARVIREQKASREKRRILEFEQRDLEGRQMVAQIKRQDKEEEEQIQRKRVEGAKLLHEVLIANEESSRRKLELLDREREEDERIVEYIRKRDAKEAAFEEEKERERARAEAETGRLRAMQEKHADEQAEEDQRRARRYQDQKQREERREVVEKDQKSKQSLKELKQAREEQKRIQSRAKAEEAIFQKAAYEKVLKEQKELHEREIVIERNKVHERKLHSLEIRRQIVANAESKVSERADYLEEGKLVKAEQRAYHEKLERIRMKKIDQLIKAKVPDKYLAELRAMKIENH